MSKRIVTILVTVIVMMGVGSYAQATPLALDYSVTNLGGGTYDYEFTLSLDNNDGSWGIGQGWGGIVFGDAPWPNTSPLTDFVLDTSDLPVGPYTSYSTSGGAHNGPTFTPALNYWTPTSVGDSLNWSGTSTADLAQGELLFSTLFVQNGAVRANFEVANRPTAIPEPATLLLLVSGLAGLGFARKRFKS
ncbi:MAG: PEP-CTERM sorting domain-containing protein [Thermodesulfobacteriota bacterium]